MSVPGTAPAVVSPPEPDLTPREMLRRAEAMRQVLRERQPLWFR